MVLNKLADLEETGYINSEEEREENCISCWKQKQRDENFYKSLHPNLIPLKGELDGKSVAFSMNFKTISRCLRWIDKTRIIILMWMSRVSIGRYGK